MHSLNSIKTSKAIVSEIEDEIVLIEFPTPNTEINYEDSQAIFEARTKLFEHDDKQLLLVRLQTNPKPDKDARDYAKNRPMNDLTLGMAMVVKSVFSRVIGNFFVGVNRGDYPVKLFTDEEEAKEWLLSLRE